MFYNGFLDLFIVFFSSHPLGKPQGFIELCFFITEIISYFLGYNGNLFDYIFILIFSLYLGYDWCKAQYYPKTYDNAIDSALDIYLDVINLFIRLLSILGDKDD